MRSFVVVGLLAFPTYLDAAPMTVDGWVTDAQSRWTEDHSRIITEATVQTATGPVVVSQLGGSVDGYGMRTFPGETVLVPGMMVTVGAHDDMDLSGLHHNVVDGVKVLAAPSDFVRSGPTKAGHYLYWESGCIFLTLDSDGTKEIPGDQEFPVIDTAIATWNDGVASCSYIKVVDDGRKAMEVDAHDFVNLLKFRDASWCRPATMDDPARCYLDASAGLTTATYIDDATSDRDGAIVDADIEINGKNFAIALNGQTLGTAPCQSELQNVLTHELGHFHGLEHTCVTADDPPRTDGTGAPVPSCTSPLLPPAITEATMYPFQDCGETKKETLETDDINGICQVYPESKNPGTCEHVSVGTGCCSASRDTPFGAFALAGLVAAGLGRRRPRRKT
jgi:MYXO-CTERM domain-containing protein